MRLIRTSLIVISLSSLFVTATFADVTGSNEVACSNYGTDALSCNQCFDGGTDYVGDTTAKAFDDTFINGSTTDDYIIRRASGLSAGPVPLQSGVTVGLSSDYGITFPASIVWFDYGGDVAVLFFGTSTPIARMNGGVLFTATSTGANPNKPALRFEYITSFQKYDFGTSAASGPVMTHKECAFVSPRFCGDGLVTNGEMCDDGSQNGQAGKCNLSCTNTIPNPTCDSMTATPISGAAPLDVSVSCNATNATTYNIDCGNGTTNLASTAVCRYVTGGTFTPRCTVNGSVTSPACTKTITVSPPPPTPACSTVITGTQTFSLTSVTPGLCNVGTVASGSFNTVIVGTQTNYTWNCTNGTVNTPVCSANYTPPQPNAPDLALKKYVNGSDAQNVAAAVDISNNTTFNYTVEIKNVGSGALNSSTTTVNDPLPAGITLTATPAGTGWICSGATGAISFSCTRTEALAVGASFPTINVPVRITSNSTYLTNTAELTNPLDVFTANNTDPAVIHIIPTLLPPVCSSTVSGALSAPITAGVCNSGSPINFIAVGTNPINYSWNCTNTVVNTPACTASYTPTVSLFDLSIKKYVNGSDAQNGAAAVNIPTNTGFTYTLQVKNEGPLTATGLTTVTDTLPAGVTLLSVPNVSPWTCTTNIPTNSFACTTSVTIASGATLANITVNAATTANTGTITNIGTVSNTGDTNVVNNTDPAVIIAGGTSVNGFDLSLKKYIGTNDAQTAALGVSTTTNAVLTYILRVTNSGASTQSTSGTTTVQDILPAGVEYDTASTGTGWTCAVVTRTLRCTSVQVVAPGASYPDILIPIRVTIGAGQSVTNIAAVDNPNEANRCTTLGSLPTTDSTFCTLDVTNSDPAVLYISGGGGGGTNYYVPTCINGIRSCSAQVHTSIPGCQLTTGQTCYNDLTACNAGNTLTCGGPGGGGCTNPNGCTTYTGGSCGDGVLGSSAGEECDVVGAPWCVSCKIVGLTNPGANPITDLWMNIPVLAGTRRIGYSWLDGVPGKVAFSDNRMVLGAGTKAFTLNDTVGFGIKTQYQIPLIIEANKKICLKSEGSALNSEAICTAFGTAASMNPGIEQWTRVDGVQFVNIGAGEYQKINPSPRPPMPSITDPNYAVKLQAYYDWRQYVLMNSHSANNITLFKGTTQYARINETNLGPTLNSAFFGKIVGDDGTIGIFTDAGVDLVKLSVKVSGAVVSSIGSSANRSLQAFLNPGNLFANFMTATSGNTSTTSNNTATTNTTVNLPVITGGLGGTVRSVADIERYAVNGNKNILAVNGDLTVECPVGRSIFEMNGVRTVIVSGNLIIKCNIVYASNDAVSSWAWIAKGGNIQVFNGTNSIPSVGAITNLAGVFVAIKETTGGDITYTGISTTQAILRVDGSLYGNATPLFSSRLYARATGAYDILTTGTILTYSNRALVSPPPLLSQYLGNYQVQRVVQ